MRVLTAGECFINLSVYSLNLATFESSNLFEVLVAYVRSLSR